MLISKLTNFKKKTTHFQNNILIVTLDFTYITLNDLNIFYCLEKLCVQVMKIIPTTNFSIVLSPIPFHVLVLLLLTL